MSADPNAFQTTNLIGDLIIVKDMDHLIDPRKRDHETIVRKKIHVYYVWKRTQILHG